MSAASLVGPKASADGPCRQGLATPGEKALASLGLLVHYSRPFGAGCLFRGGAEEVAFGVLTATIFDVLCAAHRRTAGVDKKALGSDL